MRIILYYKICIVYSFYLYKIKTML